MGIEGLLLKMKLTTLLYYTLLLIYTVFIVRIFNWLINLIFTKKNKLTSNNSVDIIDKTPVIMYKEFDIIRIFVYIFVTIFLVAILLYIK